MARDIVKTDAYLTSKRERKKIEMLFAHLNASSSLADCDYADQTARVTSSTLQPPPRTSESWLS